MHPIETRPGEPELQFRTAFDKLPTGVAHVGCDGRLLRANARLCELSGREHHELVGLRIENLVPRDDLDVVARHTLRLLSGEISRASLEMHVLRPSGTLLRTRVSLSLQHDAAGRPEHFIAVVDEAGGHDSGEAALLRRQEGRLRRALDAARLDVFEYEPLTGRVTRQGRLGRRLGLPPGYSGTDFFALILPEDRPGFFAALEGLSPQHPAYTFEYRVRTPEGGTLWLLDRARGLFDEQGRLVRVAGVFADITPRKEAEQALAQERERLQRTLDGIPVMLCLFDPQHGRVTLNRQFETVLGWTTEDANEDGFLARLYPDDPSAREHSLEAALSLGANCRRSTVSARDGTRVPCEWIHTRLSDDTKIIIGRDLRQRHASEERLARHAERQALLLELSSGMLRAGQDEAAAARPLLKRIGAHLNGDIRFDYPADTPASVLQWIAGLGIPLVLRKALRQLPPAPPPCEAEALATETLVLGEPFVVPPEDTAFLHAMGVRAYAGQPLHARDGRALGTLALSSTRRDAFTPDEVDFFRTLCHFVMLAGKRLLSERELRKRKQQYRMALEAKGLGSWRREILDSHIYHLDPRAQAHYGLSQADATEAALLERVHPEDRPQVEQYIALGKRQRVGQDSQGLEYRVVHPDGSTRWLSVQAKLVLEQREGASVLVRHGITADITERKRAEQALLEEMADLHRAQALAGVGHWRFDRRQRSGAWSEQARRMLGLPAGRTPDCARFLACIHPEDRARVEEAWKEAAAGARPCDIEHRIVVGSQVKRVRHKALLEFDERGELLAGFVTVQDIG